MSVGINSMIAQTSSPLTSVGMSKTQNPKSELVKLQENRRTDLCLQKTLFNENLIENYNNNGLFDGYRSYEGTINNKPVSLVTQYHPTAILSGYNTYQGVVGEESANIKVEGIFPKGTFINGVVGDKSVDLNVKQGILGNFSITGTIDGKEINIKKGSSLDATQGENDVLTLVTSLTGHSFKIKNGNFGGLGLSKQAQITQNEQAMYAYAMST